MGTFTVQLLCFVVLVVCLFVFVGGQDERLVFCWTVRSRVYGSGSLCAEVTYRGYSFWACCFLDTVLLGHSNVESFFGVAPTETSELDIC